MNHIQHRSNNDVLGAPPGVTIDECRALPITRVKYPPNDIPAVVSFWKPTREELEAINRGEPIYLSIIGNTHAPVLLGVGSPV